MSNIILGILVSGNGSNLQAIIDSLESGNPGCEIAVVISDRPDAYAIKRAEKHKIATVVLESGSYSDKESYDAELARTLKNYHVNLVVLAGFMRILTPALLKHFPHAVMNIHPSILPAFPGLHVQKKAIEYGVRFSGCTVHFVDEGVDTGPIIIQGIVPVLDSDDEDSLSKRILAVEHRIYPYAIRLYAEGRLTIKGRSVIIKDHPIAEGFMVSPPLLPA